MSTRRVTSYRAALEWIAHNDDNVWLEEEDGIISVTLSMAADLFGRTDKQAIADLRRTVKRLQRPA